MSMRVLYHNDGKYIVKWNNGFSIGEYKISNLSYADDTTLITTSIENIIRFFRKPEEQISEKNGLIINRKNTKMMLVN